MLKNKLLEMIIAAADKMVQKGLKSEDLFIEVSEAPENIDADFSTNFCMVNVKVFRTSPKVLATDFIKHIKTNDLYNDLIDSVSVVGPGFVNFKIKPGMYVRELEDIIDKNVLYGKRDANGERVLIEFVSANPTGPLHIGHARGAAIGDVLANIYKFNGYEVEKEYYVNDFGNQMQMLAVSLKERFKEVIGKKGAVPDNGYKGEYLIKIARDLKNELGDNINIDAIDFKGEAIGKIRRLIERDLEDFGVTFDNWISETKLHIKKENEKGNGKSPLDEVLDMLKKKKVLVNHEGAWWLKTKDDADDKDRVVIREDGRPTYFAADIAYHYQKYKRGYNKLINILGADHHGYVARLKAAVSYLGYDKKSLEVILYQLVSLIKDGQKVAMSTRQGKFVTLREVLDDVGSDAMRFFLLMRGGSTHLEFDLDLARKTTNENPVYYVQYAHARISSIFREARNVLTNYDENKKYNLIDFINTPEDFELIKCLSKYPYVIDKCVYDNSPHHITTYLQELASKFHYYYTKNKIADINNKELSYARLCVCKGVAIIIKSGLTMLGVSAPEKM